MNTGISKYELLLAISMSEFYRTTHVHFLPPGKEYISMLAKLKNKKLIEPVGEKFYKLTDKGRMSIKSTEVERFRDIDKQIDDFVNNL